MSESRTIQLWTSGRSVTYRGQYPHYEIQTPEGWIEACPGEQREIHANVLAERFVEIEIYCCDSSLVEDLIAAEHEGFACDDIENTYLDPSDWDLQRCREYLEGQGVDTDGLPSPDPYRGWPTVEMVATALQRYQDHHAIYAEQAESDSFTLELCIDADGSWSVSVEESDDPVTVGDYEATWRGDPRSHSTLELAAMLLEPCREEHQGLDDDDLLERYQDAVREHSQDNPQEAYEWWRVSPWLVRKLRELGEIVIENGYGCWWGRGCTGQSMLMDGTLQQVALRVVDA